MAAILAGEKTTTTGLVAEYEHANDPLPVRGLREVVVDSGGRPVAVIETSAVRVVRLVGDDTLVVASEFRLIEDRDPARLSGCPPAEYVALTQL